ncbi:hypothetical protein HCDSEM_179 [Candidatus Hodgkinia cicadicola Dsem]|nr:hypothetical protein HCDSEM_179 [Candidatus Hodgkinia cicadicola Dsem]
MTALALPLASCAIMLPATSAWVYWHYKSSRKNKAFETRQTLFGGEWWTGAARSAWSCAALKTIITRLLIVTADGLSGEGSQKPPAARWVLGGLLALTQAAELWWREPHKHMTTLPKLCLNSVLLMFLGLSSVGVALLAANALADQSSREAIVTESALSWYWVALASLWEAFYQLVW